MPKTFDDIGLMDIFKFYQKHYTDTVKEDVFKKVIKSFNKELLDLIFEGRRVTLPRGCGDLFIRKYKTNYNLKSIHNIDRPCSAKTDYKKTKDLWKEHPELEKKVFLNYDNTHSDHYTVRIVWSVATNNLLTNSFTFKPSRRFKRGLAATVKKDINVLDKYIEYVK